MNPICFYHKSDLDGVCSAAIVKRFVPDCELYGIDYGDEFPWNMVHGFFEGIPPSAVKRTVYMVDFSLIPECMQELAAISNLIWIDHHKSAIDGNAGLQCRGVRDSSVAACELCWSWFRDAGDDQRQPEAVRLLGVYDSWRVDAPEWESKILPFQYGMRNEKNIYDPESEDWKWLLDWSEDDIEAGWLIEDGEKILRYQAEQNSRACKAGAYDFMLSYATKDSAEFDDPKATFRRWLDEPHKALFEVKGSHSQYWPVRHCFRVLACNTIVFNSQFFDGFYDPKKHDVMCAYCQLASGAWKVSLYTTKEDVDCSAIAKAFGGGGHRKAAGFICETLPWEEYD